MSRFYYPNVVGKGQQIKMQRRVVVVVTFCPSFIKAYYVATRVSVFLTLCFNVAYLSAD